MIMIIISDVRYFLRIVKTTIPQNPSAVQDCSFFVSSKFDVKRNSIRLIEDTKNRVISYVPEDSRGYNTHTCRIYYHMYNIVIIM